MFPAADRDALAALIAQLGPLPPVADLSARERLSRRSRRDKKVRRRPAALRAADGDRRDCDVVDDVTEDEIARHALRSEYGLKLNRAATQSMPCSFSLLSSVL